MKTLENFIEDLEKDPELSQLFKSEDAETITKQANEAGYSFTANELEAFVVSKVQLSQEELETVVGGVERSAKQWFKEFGRKFLPWLD